MILDDELVLAKRISISVGSKWSAVEIDDLTSELILWLYAHADTVRRYRTEEGGQGKLFVALRRTAGRYCVKAQEARTGGPLETDAPYSTAQIERAMPYIFEPIPETTVFEKYGKPAGAYPTDGGKVRAILLDVSIAYDALPPEHKTVLTLRFRDGLTYTDIGALTGVSDVAARARVIRALERTRDYLSGDV
jgi:DNA-directed RNA polymerase specialized sigma24 family protein